MGESGRSAATLSGPRRLPDRLLLAAVGVGLAAVIGFAVSSVSQSEFVHSYRPLDLASNTEVPPNPAVAPLALARGIPDELDVTLPCEIAAPASAFTTFRPELWRTGDGESRSTLLFPDLGDPLRVAVTERSTTVVVGFDEVLDVPIDTGPGCTVVIRYDQGHWSASSGDVRVEALGRGPTFVEAVFSGPAATSPVSEVQVVARELGTSPGAAQWVLLVVAVAAIVVVAREIWVRDARRDSALKAIRRPIDVVDVVVVSTLTVWWVFIPLNIDDGWIAARVGSYPAYGDIAGIFTAHSAPMPFGYWLEWLQHFWLGLSDQPIVMRLPAMAIGAATWFGLRSLGRRNESRATAWVMGGVFVVGFGAWGVTLRAEPILAALLVASVVLAVRFRGGERGRVLVWWALVMALAVSAHPAGVIVLAPALGSWRSILGWVRDDRSSRVVAAGLVALFIIAAGLLFFVDSNIAAKTDSIDAYRSEAHSLGVLDEPVRYRFLNDTPYSTPMRRASVALTFVAVAGFVIRRRPRPDVVFEVAGWTLFLGLVLLTFTPSKWPWHLGGLIGIASVVLARSLVEVRRWRAVATVALLIVASAWAWSDSLGWAVFDLRSNRWVSEPGDLFGFSLASIFTWVIVAVLIAGAQRLWLHRMWSVPSVLAVVSVITLIVVTGATLIADTVTTPAWTFGRQNLSVLVGRGDCGLGEEVLVPVPGSLHPLTVAGRQTSPDGDMAASDAGFSDSGVFGPVGYPRTGINRSYPMANMTPFGSWVEHDGMSANANRGGHRSEWRVIASGDERVALMVMGGFDLDGNAMALQWGMSGSNGVMAAGIDEVGGLSGVIADWRLIEFGVPESVDRVRVLVRDDSAGSGDAWIASSAPLAFSRQSVSRLVEAAPATDVLVSPALAPYFPCVRPPLFAAGIVPAPDVLIQTWPVVWETTFAAAAASDRYFRIDVAGEPPYRSETIGAHAGDVDNFVFVSEEYLTGSPARANGAFTEE